MQLGETIRTLRKNKGYTQERLAHMLGVSSPAVSKWENDAAYPDIMLLPPLARALGTTVDDLLQFRQTLTEEDVHAVERELCDLFRAQGAAIACARAEALLQEYPNSMYLKFRVGGLYQRWLAFKEDLDDAGMLETLRRCAALFSEIVESGDAQLHTAAKAVLASHLIMLEDYAQAEALLCSLPKAACNPDELFAVLHMAQGDLDAAAKQYRRNLYATLVKAMNALTGLAAIEEKQQGAAQALPWMKTYLNIVEMLDYRDTTGYAYAARLYAALGSTEEALACMERWRDNLLSLKEGLFGPHAWMDDALQTMPPDPELYIAAARRAILSDTSQYGALAREPRFQAILDSLGAC